MVIPGFTFARTPRIHFGAGKFETLSDIIPSFGKNVLFVTGTGTLERHPKFKSLLNLLKSINVAYHHVTLKGEPSPDMVDHTVDKFKEIGIELVVSIGGGSAIDAGKAISAMLTQDASVIDYLEGVGKGISHNGKKVPFIAVPTTAGTGSEATKNAVLSKIGPKGFKKSLRHDNFVPDIAIIDPELTLDCPPGITAASGLDAFTQLLESYTSTASNPLTDALALSSMKMVIGNLIPACTNGRSDISVRNAMSYGALLSGITLANAGLGIIHGLASAIGGLFEIPHGVICGTLANAATELNIQLLKKTGSNRQLLIKYAEVGKLFADETNYKIYGQKHYLDLLINKLNEWVLSLNIPRLGEFGILESDLNCILSKTGIKNNPVDLNKDQIRSIVMARL
ncbi:iron-containing alcohol dehydrogenase [bacterium]|nr:iron-containing alcohol dehydrogenase [bacterium]